MSLVFVLFSYCKFWLGVFFILMVYGGVDVIRVWDIRMGLRNVKNFVYRLFCGWFGILG